MICGERRQDFSINRQWPDTILGILQESPFALNHALYMKIIHDGKAKMIRSIFTK
jgi:hypothetical protein